MQGINVNKCTSPFKIPFCILAILQLPLYHADAQTNRSNVVITPEDQMSAEQIGEHLFGKVISAPRKDTSSEKRRSLGTTRGIHLLPKAEETTLEKPTIAVPINFGFGSFNISTEAKLSLDKIGTVLIDPRYKNNRIVIEGHTDTVGEFSYNLNLSFDRANSVSEYLSSKFGIEKHRLTIIPMGEQSPLAAYAETHPYQRRVEFRALN